MLDSFVQVLSNMFSPKEHQQNQELDQTDKAREEFYQKYALAE